MLKNLLDYHRDHRYYSECLSIYECVEFTPSNVVSHLRIVKKAR